MFLPIAGFKLEGVPPYTKTAAASYGAMLGLLVFHLPRLMSLRPSLLDLPAICLSLVSFVSSMVNGLGAYDGMSATFSSIVTWFVPYVCGRAAFRSVGDLGEAIQVLFWGGLIYMPLCLIEIRMSPQLNVWVYGFMQHSFAQTIRFGGYRPMVFMQHGLAVGLWMCIAALAGYFFWTARACKPRFSPRMRWFLGALFLTAILCKSTGALALLAVGIAVIEMGRRTARPWVLLGVALATPLFLGGRIGGVWDGRGLVDLTTAVAGDDRAESLNFRLNNEDQLLSKAMERPAFGWGGWGRNRVYNDQGRDTSVTDGLWIILLGTNGLVGLGSFVALMSLPPVVYAVSRIRTDHARVPVFECASVVVILFLMDCIPNAMINPFFIAVCGGMSTIVMQGTVRSLEQSPRRRSSQPQLSTTTKPVRL